MVKKNKIKNSSPRYLFVMLVGTRYFGAEGSLLPYCCVSCPILLLLNVNINRLAENLILLVPLSMKAELNSVPHSLGGRKEKSGCGSVITLRKRTKSYGLFKKHAFTLGVAENRTITY